MRERLFVKLSTIVMRIISKSFEVSARKVTQTGYFSFIFMLIFSERSQDTAKGGENISDVILCYHILTKSVIYS